MFSAGQIAFLSPNEQYQINDEMASTQWLAGIILLPSTAGLLTEESLLPFRVTTGDL